ncbi:MAG TPA: VOC family protein [Thermoplasmata archaeon]|nr:VOC family protein [Thermoplasmata archaeon]
MARKTRRAKAPARKAKKALAPVTPGIRTVTPYLFMNGAAKAIEFYRKAFGAKEIDRSPMPDGTLMHATIKIGDSIVMMSDAFSGGDSSSPVMAGTTTVNLHIYSKDVNKLWAQALAAGAEPTMPLEDQFWGERYGKLRDPFGHVWSVAMPVRMSKQVMERKRQAAMAMFEKGEHPGE